MQLGGQPMDLERLLQFDKDRANLLDFLVVADNVLISKQVVKTQLPSLDFSLGASVEGAVFGPHWFGRVACHPEGLFVGHTYLTWVVAGRGNCAGGPGEPRLWPVQLEFRKPRRRERCKAGFCCLKIALPFVRKCN